MLGKLLIFNLISYNTVCNTNTTTNANEIKALTRIESEHMPPYYLLNFHDQYHMQDLYVRNKQSLIYILYKDPKALYIADYLNLFKPSSHILSLDSDQD